MTPPSEPTKAALRAQMRTTLAGISDSRWVEASVGVCDRLIQRPEFIAAKTVLAYLPIRGEIDLSQLCLAAIKQGKSLCLPRLDWTARTMSAAAVTSLEDTHFETIRHGIRCPPPECSHVPISQIDLVLVPGMAFTESQVSSPGKKPGFARLGRGAGYYDRFLTTPGLRAMTVGIAIKQQLLPAIPVDPWDVLLEAIATPDGFIATR